MAVYYFNPETDYALASGRNTYNPPVRIKRMKESMMLFPATFAAHGDVVAVDEMPASGSASPHLLEMTESKGIAFVRLDDVPSIIAAHNMDFRPWGWNHSLLHSLRKLGFPQAALKSEQEIDDIRTLSHRRTSIAMAAKLQTLLPDMEIDVPKECDSPDAAVSLIEELGDAFVKLPWSSSGRGVVRTSDLNAEKLRQWIHGGINKQGSVLIEKAHKKSADFATEWHCSGGKAKFIGLSLFKASPSGRYISNVIAPQEELRKMITSYSPQFGNHLIEAQKEALDSLIAPRYSGPLGIDMLATADGCIAPCIEINLRMTMGMAHIIK